MYFVMVPPVGRDRYIKFTNQFRKRLEALQ
jgi:hypothetical protein